MSYKRHLSALLATGALLATASPAWAATIVDGTDSNIAINDGAFIDGTRDDDQSTFSGGITSDDLTGSWLFSDIPTAIVNGVQSFVFIFDSQETGGNPPITIDDIVIEAGGMTIWSLADSIELTGGTATPLGNGADLALSIPVLLFADKGLTGADSLTFSWTQSNDQNGFDEWVLVGDGFFDPGDPINPVPLPAAAWFFVTAVGGLVLSRRRRQQVTKST